MKVVNIMKGVEFFFDAKGKPKAALIDFCKGRQVWDDFQEFLPSPEERQRLLLFDENGKPKTALISLRKYGSLWEDFRDILVVRERSNEPTLSAEDVDEFFIKINKTRKRR